jgi:hypothetical protein
MQLSRAQLWQLAPSLQNGSLTDRHIQAAYLIYLQQFHKQLSTNVLLHVLCTHILHRTETGDMSNQPLDVRFHNLLLLAEKQGDHGMHHQHGLYQEVYL